MLNADQLNLLKTGESVVSYGSLWLNIIMEPLPYLCLLVAYVASVCTLVAKKESVRFVSGAVASLAIFLLILGVVVSASRKNTAPSTYVSPSETAPANSTLLNILNVGVMVDD